MIGYYSIAPYFACMALILALAATPLLKWADTPPSPGGARISSIDGLRGFLALAVFFHHGTVYHNWLLESVWALPPSRFYSQLGQSGVAFFFMISGYLFWGKLLRANGRINFPALYIGRICRIGPLYIVSVSIMLAIIFWHTGFTFHVPFLTLFQELIIWLALGFFGDGPNVNGDPNPSVPLAGVTWSLQVEWWFYLSFLLTCYIARRGKISIVVMILALCLLLVVVSLPNFGEYVPYGYSVCYLIFGMLSASLERNNLLLKAPDWVSSSALIVLLGSDFTFFGSAYEAGPMLIMGLCFYMIISGAKLFGLLVSRPAIRLGDISYGTYLLQGLVLYSIFSFPPLKTFAFYSPLTYWVTLLGCATLLVIVATISHVLIERPGIDFGKFLISKVGWFSPSKPITFSIGTET